MPHKGPASSSEKERKTQRLQYIIIIIIRSRCCKGMRGLSRVILRQDSYDNHHRRTGEEVINKEDIKGQEPNDEKTRLMTSTMTSSIIHHIWTCAIHSFAPSESQDSPTWGTGCFWLHAAISKGVSTVGTRRWYELWILWGHQIPMPHIKSDCPPCDLSCASSWSFLTSIWPLLDWKSGTKVWKPQLPEQWDLGGSLGIIKNVVTSLFLPHRHVSRPLTAQRSIISRHVPNTALP